MRKPKRLLHGSRESTTQMKVIKRMSKAGWFVVKIIQTNLNGWPDLQCHKDRKTIFIECKSKNKKPTPLQTHRHKQLRKVGFHVFVISNIK